LPVVKKLLRVGGSQCISIPHNWLKNVERQSGEKVTELSMEINEALHIRALKHGRSKAENPMVQLKTRRQQT
jgi:antitoxin component of MazEF toxin-antitoxin module